MSEADLQSMGVFIEALDTSVESFGIDAHWFELPNVMFEDAVEGALDLGWGDFAWDSTEATWVSDLLRARSEAMASAVMDRSAWFVFLDQDDAVIGYRRARALLRVEPAIGGPFTINGVTYRPKTGPDVSIYAECQTGFGEGAGRVATSVGLVLDALPLDASRPGQMWLEPDQITDGTAPVALSPVKIAFGETIRGRVKILLRF